MPAKKTNPTQDAPQTDSPQKADVKKVSKKKVAPPAKLVETIVPQAEAAVPPEESLELPTSATPVSVAAVEPVAPVPAPVPSIPVIAYNPPQPLQLPLVKPGMVQAIAILTLINGILNILYGLTITGAIVLGTFFIGIICAPVTILPVILGIFEIVYSTKLLANPPQSIMPSQTIAILEIIAVVSGNIISPVVGIIALVFYADSNVRAYFARLNGQA